MRFLGYGLMLGTCFLTGCKNLFGPGITDINKDKDKVILNQTPTVPELVTYLNRESSRLQSIQSDDLKVDAEMQGQSLGLSSTLFCRSPRDFRLRGDVLATQQIDFGSNQDLFWFWIKQDPSRSVYYCKHDDFQRGGVALPFPFQPEWVVQTLGMASYDPKKNYQVETTKDSFHLVELATLQGREVKKTTVLDRRSKLWPGEPRIRSHLLQDAKTGKVICSAEIIRIKYASQEVYYPQEIVLKWPEEKVTMKMKFDGVTCNGRFKNEQATFTMPQFPNTPQVDLARATRTNPTARNIDQAGGFRP